MSDMQEVVDRCRRMETRLTRFLESQGFDTQTRRPEWRDDGVILVPSLGASLKDIQSVIPPNWNKQKEIEVYHKDTFVMAIFVS